MNVLKIDDDQKKVINCNSNCVIAAGAGSGKTTVLAGRFIKLIKSGNAGVENILTLTFTRKAAREMYERIYSLMLAEKENPLIQEGLMNFDKVQISTLDSFCSRIVKNCPEQFGLSPDFSMDEERIRSLAEESSMEFILENKNNPALKEFICLNEFENVWKAFFADIAINYLSIGEDIDFNAMYIKQITALKKYLKKAINNIDDIYNSILSLKSEKKEGAIPAAIEILSGTTGLRNLLESNQYEMIENTIKNIKLRKPGGRVKNEDILILKENIDEYRKEKEKIIEIVNTLKNSKTLKGMFSLCGEFQATFFNKKINAGILTFRDIAKMAVSVLERNNDLCDYYRSYYKFIMIDEFQDNNLLQKKLLFLLAGKKGGELQKNKLFLVGDEKQSIYRFRGADVSVFKALSKEIKNHGGESLSLLTNYRSGPDLIDFFNKIFSKVFEKAEEKYEARFVSLKKRPSRAGEKSKIRIFYKPDNTESSAERPDEILSNDEAEAWHIGTFIKKSVENKTIKIYNKAENSFIGAEYDDFVILLRSSGNQIKYEKVFRQLDIPYSTQNVRSLFLEAPLNDIYNLLQIAVYPEDRLSFAAYLRSPFVNISDELLIRILLESEKAFGLTEIDEIITSNTDKKKYLYGKELYMWVLKNHDKLSIRELLFHIWFTSGYRYILLKNKEWHNYMEYYDYLDKIAEKSDRRGECLGVFLDFLRSNMGKNEKIPELEIIREEVSGVKIMTIHKSKGLEFPVTIIANAGNIGRQAGKGKSPYYISEEFGLTINIAKKYNFFFSRALEENRKMELAELKRLLYVGMTRAESHLIISGCHNRRNKSKTSSLLNLTLLGLGWDPSGEIEPQETENLKKYIDIIADVGVNDIKKYNRRKNECKIDKILAAYKEREDEEIKIRKNEYSVTEINEYYKNRDYYEKQNLSPIKSDKYIEENNLENNFGILCHYILEKRINGNLNTKPLPLFLQKDIPDKYFDPMVEDAVELSNGFTESEYSHLMKKAVNIETELPFILKVTPLPIYIKGQIDLLNEGEQEVIIIDFKTDKTLVKGEYDIQMLLYKMAAEEFTAKKVRPVIFYLRDSLIVTPEKGDKNLLIEKISAMASE